MKIKSVILNLDISSTTQTIYFYKILVNSIKEATTRVEIDESNDDKLTNLVSSNETDGIDKVSKIESTSKTNIFKSSTASLATRVLDSISKGELIDVLKNLIKE